MGVVVLDGYTLSPGDLDWSELETPGDVVAHDRTGPDEGAIVQRAGWARSADFCYWLAPQIELSGRTMGIIGFGRIGRRVGEIAHAFGMRVIANDASPVSPPAWPGFAWREVDELPRESDVVSLHCPLTPENAGMIDAALRGQPVYDAPNVAITPQSHGRPERLGHGCSPSQWTTCGPSWPATLSTS